ncbi:hypothetical protein FDECE_1007 [Fusarium decemcellulare]|nr:hypothetical protein FDECE_1007 [Fusarium decemcellulare]
MAVSAAEAVPEQKPSSKKPQGNPIWDRCRAGLIGEVTKDGLVLALIGGSASIKRPAWGRSALSRAVQSVESNTVCVCLGQRPGKPDADTFACMVMAKLDVGSDDGKCLSFQAWQLSGSIRSSPWTWDLTQADLSEIC